MSIISRLPRNDQTNAWNTILPQRTPHAALAKDIKADWLVIGGAMPDWLQHDNWHTTVPMIVLRW